MKLNLEDGRILVSCAREIVASTLKGISFNTSSLDKFTQKRGIFVTIYTKSEDLRGCIGIPEPIYSLKEGLLHAAPSAAFDDPRFPHLQESELDDVSFEVSVLTRPKLLEREEVSDYLKQITIGSDGLIIRSPLSSGLLLPQVAVEYGWDAEEFLRHTCEKAGLHQDAWKDKSSRIYTFQSQIFYESPDGSIEEK